MGQNINRFEIIRKVELTILIRGIKPKSTTMGLSLKLAIYCSNIEVLEEEVYPFLVSDLQINPTEVLKYHGGNKRIPYPKENELEFRSLDPA